MVVSLRNVDISHSTGHYIDVKKCSALLRKSWARHCLDILLFITIPVYQFFYLLQFVSGIISSVPPTGAALTAWADHYDPRGADDSPETPPAISAL